MTGPTSSILPLVGGALPLVAAGSVTAGNATPEPTEPGAPLLGIDWGTTNRRAYVLDGHGKLVRQYSDEFGILAVAGNFEHALADLLKRLELERADVVMSGMVGSRNGWRQVPYLSVNQSISALADAMVEVNT